MSIPTLTVIAGGRNKAEVVQVARADWDETRIELATSYLERRRFVRGVRTATTHALSRLYRPEPDTQGAERWLVPLLRCAAQEEARLAFLDGDGPSPEVAA